MPLGNIITISCLPVATGIIFLTATGLKPTQLSVLGSDTSDFLKTQGFPISKNVYGISNLKQVFKPHASAVQQKVYIVFIIC